MFFVSWVFFWASCVRIQTVHILFFANSSSLNCSINFDIRRRSKIEDIIIFSLRKTTTDSSEIDVALLDSEMFFEWLIKEIEKNEFQLMLKNEEFEIDMIEKRIETTELFEWLIESETCFRSTVSIDLKFFNNVCTSSESESQIFHQWRD